MQDLCPLCSKNGVRNTVKPMQINLQEAVWMCESEKCAWPFGYEEFIFVPRAVGKAWSCYWTEDKTTIPRIRESILSSKKSLANEQSLARPVAGPKVLTTACSDYDFARNTDTAVMNDVKVKIEYESEPLEMTFPFEELSTTTHNIDQSQQNDSKSNTPNQFYINSTNYIDKFDLRNLLCANSDNENTQDIKSERKFPIITNIETTNIDIKIDDSNSLDKDIRKDIKKEDIALAITKSELDDQKSEMEKFHDQRSISSTSHHKQSLDQKISKDVLDNIKVETDTTENMNVTKMEVDGLPPITLSYETPVCTTTNVGPKSVCKTELSETEKTSKANQPAVANGKATVETGLCKKAGVPSLQNNKRQIFRGKKYEKFSFSVFKKKVEPTDSNNKNESNDCNDKINTIPSSPNVNSTMVNQSNLTTIVKSEPVSNNLDSANTSGSDTSFGNTSINLDTVLNDIFANNYAVPEDSNDDWLESLLN